MIEEDNTKIRLKNLKFYISKELMQENETEFLSLKIELTQDLINLLKSICLEKTTNDGVFINGLSDRNFFSSNKDSFLKLGLENHVYQYDRYLIKNGFLSSLDYHIRLLFNLKVLEHKKMVLYFDNILALDNFISCLKEDLKILISKVLDLELSQQINYILREND